jgi:hypothetical protein
MITSSILPDTFFDHALQYRRKVVTLGKWINADSSELNYDKQLLN